MAISKHDAIILAHEAPAELFAAEVEGQEIGIPDDYTTHPVTIRVDRAALAHVDIFAKRRRSSRARVVAEIFDIGFQSVLAALSKETREQIESEAVDILRAEYAAEKEGK